MSEEASELAAVRWVLQLPECLGLDLAYALAGDAEFLADPLQRARLAAVIEATDGSLSYWALAHPSDKPDFHHPDSFVLELS